MRRFLVVPALFVTACDSHTSDLSVSEVQKATPAQTVSVRPDQLKLNLARKEIKKEPSVRDFVLEPKEAVMLQVAVNDDGKRRYGLAGYFCLKLKEWGLYHDNAIVRIVDASQIEFSQGDFRSISLGTVQCKDESRLD